MKTMLTTFAMTVLSLTLPVGVSADDSSALFNLTSLNDATAPSPALIQDTALSHIRGQGFQMPDIHTGVILWDEVDSGQKPKNQYMGTDGVISIKVK